MQLNIGEKLRSFFANSKRVLIIARKPTWQEFQAMSKVTGIGIVVIAVIAYIVYMVFSFTPLG